MTGALKKQLLVAVLVLAAVMAVGTATASAHGGGGGRGGKDAVGGVNLSTLVTRAATQLNVTRASLTAAIRASAVARIDAAVADEEITTEEAAELKDEVEDNLRFAYELSRASVVASNLRITTTALNNGFRAARRAIATARIDQAVEDEELTAEEAGELKEELADADVPGYKPSSLGGLRSRGGFDGYGGFGSGFGEGFDGFGFDVGYGGFGFRR